jgi:tRNA(Arg) A34 adenosine deaminase TadA
MVNQQEGSAMKNPKFMKEAVRLARKGMRSGDGGPFGAVVVRDGVIVARGWNRVLKTLDPTAHAEITAIREACQVLGRFHLEDCELYTSCEPCPMCLGAILWARLGAIHYAATRADAAAVGFDDSCFYDEVAKPSAGRTLPCHHLPYPGAIKAMQEWQQKADKTKY